MNKILRLSLLFITSCLCTRAMSQSVPPLEREISISFRGDKIDAVLSRISQEAKFTFSYSPSIFSANLVVNDSYENKSIREILNRLFGETINYKAKGNYIILTKAPPPPRAEEVDNSITLSGYVFNGDTGEKLAEVSVYDKMTLTAVVTNQFGYFKIKIDKPSEETILSFSKRHFTDTLINLSQGSTQFLTISLSPEPVQVVVEQRIDTVEIQRPPIVVVERKPTKERKEQAVNMINIKDTLYRKYQVSFVPFAGTNHKLSGNVVNDYSFNILGGYSMGTRIVELGGLFNIDRADVSSAQFAGLFNTVGGKTDGAQFAGLGNLTRKKVTGGQFAGLFNANLDSVDGGQFGGLFNINGRASRGTMFAGLFNVQPSYYSGAQFAGLFNINTHRMEGVQVSGLINFAHKIKGAQIGFINYADSIQGVPIGFLSFVSRGYHKIEISTNEIFYVNAAFRTGIRQFYNILEAGIKPESMGNANPSSASPKENIWYFGYGVGTAPRLSKRLSLNFDITASHINKGSFTNSISLLNKFYMGVDFQVAKLFSITAGATLNAYLTDSQYADNPSLFTDFSPTLIRDRTYSNGDNLRMWWGAKLGVRFL